MSALGGQIEAMVRTSPECAWSATTNATWLQVQPPSGQGEVAITLQVAENKLPNERIGAIHVNGLDVMLAQAAFVPPPPPPPPPRRLYRQPRPRRLHRQPRPRRLCRRPRAPTPVPPAPSPDACTAGPEPRRLYRRPRAPTPVPPAPTPTPVPPAPTPTPVPPAPTPTPVPPTPTPTCVAAAFSSTIQWNRIESDGHVPGAVVHRWRSFGSDGQRDGVHPRQL